MTLEWNKSEGDGDVGQFQFRYPTQGGRFSTPMRQPPPLAPVTYGQPRLDPSSMTVAQKQELAAKWDAQDPKEGGQPLWFRVEFGSLRNSNSPIDFSSYVRDTLFVNCPGGGPRIAVRPLLERRGVQRAEEIRQIYMIWAVDQVLIHGCSGAKRVDTPCPAGSTRVRTRQSPQGTCLTCAPPLRIVYDREGYADCRRAPALTQVPQPGSMRIPFRRLSGPVGVGETVVVSPAGFILGLALWGLAGYGAYKLITR